MIAICTIQGEIMVDIQEKWSQGVASELAFWRHWVETKGGSWKDDYESRLDPNMPFNKSVEQYFRFNPKELIQILDVGAGPITSLGYKSEKFELDITAIDALAEGYALILREAGIEPPVKTQRCSAEEITSYFGTRLFHVCHSRNALDHCIDPRGIITAMADQLLPDGLMYIEVYKNEAEKNKHTGLHNWNFDTDALNNFILWRDNVRYNITEDLAKLGDAALVDNGYNLIFVFYRSG